MKQSRTVGHWFYVGVIVMLILLNITAFMPAMVNESTRNVALPLTPIVTVHAILGAAWLLLFLVQVVFVASGRIALHRRLGIVGAVLVFCFTVSGILTVIAEVRRGFDLSGDLTRLPPQPGTDLSASLMGQIYFFMLFGILAGAALYFRKRPAIHKRLMLLAVLGGVMPTPVAHLIGHWSVLQPWTVPIFLLSLLFSLLLIVIGDLISERRIHPVTWSGGLTLFILNFIFNVFIVPSILWHNFAVWLTR